MSETTNDKTLFGEYAHYYDLLYRDKDYAAEARYVEGLIRKFHPPTRDILELGSGTGIHASWLAQAGFRVHGIERSREMLARSMRLAANNRLRNGQLDFSAGDIREIRLDKTFDAVISLFHVVSYQTANEDVLAAFATARHHLKPGGIFIFDVWYGPAVLACRPETRIKRMADDAMEITRMAEPVLHPNENRVDVRYHVFVRSRATGEVSELREIHAMRYFFMPEIDLWAGQSGFVRANAEEWLSSKPLDESTWSACFALTRR